MVLTQLGSARPPGTRGWPRWPQGPCTFSPLCLPHQPRFCPAPAAHQHTWSRNAGLASVAGTPKRAKPTRRATRAGSQPARRRRSGARGARQAARARAARRRAAFGSGALAGCGPPWPPGRRADAGTRKPPAPASQRTLDGLVELAVGGARDAPALELVGGPHIHHGRALARRRLRLQRGSSGRGGMVGDRGRARRCGLPSPPSAPAALQAPQGPPLRSGRAWFDRGLAARGRPTCCREMKVTPAFLMVVAISSQACAQSAAATGCVDGGAQPPPRPAPQQQQQAMTQPQQPSAPGGHPRPAATCLSNGRGRRAAASRARHGSAAAAALHAASHRKTRLPRPSHAVAHLGAGGPHALDLQARRGAVDLHRSARDARRRAAPRPPRLPPAQAGVRARVGGWTQAKDGSRSQPLQLLVRLSECRASRRRAAAAAVAAEWHRREPAEAGAHNHNRHGFFNASTQAHWAQVLRPGR